MGGVAEGKKKPVPKTLQNLVSKMKTTPRASTWRQYTYSFFGSGDALGERVL